MDRRKTVFSLMIFFVTILVFIFINAFIKSRQEYTNKYDFIIDKIETDAKGYLIFSDSLNNQYSFASYNFTEFDKLGISVGDRVFKDSYSKNMTINRKMKNEYKTYYIQKPNGMIPFLLYSY
ncbi:hypothetical protein BD847_0020 [Flavobacterium cutihirudinis]|uniref:Uncharacterized protein n=1 Tax=Flavobacterium cutihirudinis TaxID=1265740 RepID=A0A3D9FYU1_9FLAO|nr:hypothetical protein [Flavobacterium cutihirudinis]RED26114.1 hypothetical protein BD847_0020 [Flavobacterium cutihirudinis]